jgi:hypothetical protein
MRLKYYKRSAVIFVSRIIPQSGGFNTPQLAAESVSNACFGVHTRDFVKIVHFVIRQQMNLR